MAKSKMMRVEDARSVARLVGECRDLGDDWHAWLEHLLDGLLRLTDSELTIGGEVAERARRFVEISYPVFHGRPGFKVDQARIEEAIRSYTMAPGASLFVTDYAARFREDDGVALTNRDFYSDEQWQRSADMQTMGAACGTDATLLCCRKVVPGEVADLSLFRERGRRPYSQRDTTLVREALALITPMMGGPLARFSEPSAAGLSPRARQVLACFLEGDGDKQVAARLGIGAHTVNQYAKRIYRHFGVQSRTELLALWIRRGWTGRLADDARGG